MKIVQFLTQFWLPRKVLILGTGLFLLTNAHIYAQNFSDYNWLFGSHQEHLAFLKGSTELQIQDTTGISLGFTGASVATNGRTGELLMFTSGVEIYDATYQVMLGGDSLNGQQSTTNRATVIAPINGQDDSYYVIYKVPSGQLEYAIVDMASQGNGTAELPLGEVIAKNQPLITTPVGAFTAIQGGQNGPYFLVYQDASGSDDIITVTLDPLSFPPASSPQSTTLGTPFTVQSFSFSGARNTLAVAPSSPNINVHLYTMDLGTGLLSLDSVVLNSGFADGTEENVYDAELSASGRMLYVSRGGADANTGNVYQYDLDSGVAPVSVLPAAVANSYGLKLGPDGNIYHLYQSISGSVYNLGRITQADSAASVVGYSDVNLRINNWRARQFPEIAGTHPENFTVSFTTADLCTGGTTKFFAQVDPPALDYFWSFDSAGTNTSSAVSPIVEFSAAGSYEVTLTANIPGIGMQSSTQVITITDNSMNNVTIGNDTTICPGETLLLEATGNGIAGGHFWSELDSTTNQPVSGESLSVTEAGEYWVRVDFDNGCVGSASVNVEIFNQQEMTTNFWDFGDRVEIDFNETPPIISSNDVMNAPEGCATISDIGGNKILFTDGNQVFARNNTLMNPGTPIGGDLTSSQSVAIVPFINQQDENLFYYIFTTDEVDSGMYRMSYSVVDLRGGNALGEVLPVATDVPLFERATERLSQTVIDGNPTVVTHEYGTNSFVGFQITPDGVVGPVFFSGGSIHSRATASAAEGYLEFNAAGDKLAVALKTAAENTVEVFDVDADSRTLENMLQITLPDPVANHSVYGLEFSSGGSKLFISVNGAVSKVYEVRIDSPNQTFAQASLVRLSGGGGSGRSFGAIQTAPNGQVLIAIDGEDFLATILPGEDSVQSTFNLRGFPLTTADGSTVFSRLGLPNFAQSSINPPTPATMNVMDGCLGNVLSFAGTPTSQLDTLTWYFGDGNSMIGDTVSHQYATEGTYSITLQITNRCGLDTILIDTVDVYRAIPELTLPSSTSLCSDPITLDAANGIAESHWNYSWSTGESTQTIIISDLAAQGQLVSVTVTDSVGCTNTDSTLVVDGRPIFDLGPDSFACQNDAIADLNASNNGALYTWTLNGTNTGNTTRIQPVNTSLADTLMYTLTVNDTISGCSDTDTVTYIVNPVPVITTTTTPTGACGESNGRAVVMVTSPTNFSVDWSGTNNFSSTQADTDTLLESGIYTVLVTDDLTGCTTSEVVSVTDGGNDFNIVDIVPADSCVLSSALLEVDSGIPDGSDVDVYLQNQTDGLFTADVYRVISSQFRITNLSPGDYFVQVETPFGCIQDTTFTISQLPQVSLTSPTFVDDCGNSTEVTIDVSGITNPEILWTAFNGGSFPVDEDITQPTVTVDAAGLYLVTVSDESSGLCPATDSVTVNLNAFPGVSIQTEGENCEGQVTLSITTSPDGNYTTVWERNGAQVGVGPSFIATESGRYDVRSTLQSSGCQSSDFIAVVVNDPLEVITTSEPACDDGTPTLLTAIASGPNSDSLLYTWRGPGQISGTFNRNTIEVIEPGTYTVSVRRNLTPSDGCSATDQITIDLIPFDAVTATPVGVVCPPDPDFNTATLEAMGDFIRYDWYTLPDSMNIFTGGTFNTTLNSDYMVVATDAFGCRDTAFSTVRLFCEVYVRAPTAFRPGSPVGNGTYRVISENIEPGSFTAFIYNRWGELIRTFEDPDFAWDGTTVSGDPAPPGTYMVVFRYLNEYSEVDDEEYVETSQVTLFR